MKKSIVFIIALMLILTFLAGCGGKSQKPSLQPNQSETESIPSSEPAGGESETLDLKLLTIRYPASAEIGEDFYGDPIIKDKAAVYEFSFVNEVDAESLAERRNTMKEYANDEYVKDYAEFKQEIGGMTDVFCIKYNSIIWNEAYFSIAFPEPIENRAGIQICIKVRNTANKIDDVLAVKTVQDILNSIQFKG